MSEYNNNLNAENNNEKLADDVLRSDDTKNTTEESYNSSATYQTQGEHQNNIETQPHTTHYTPYQNTQYRPYQPPYFSAGVEGGASYTFSNDPSYGADINTKKEKKKKNSGALKIAAIILCCITLASATGIGGAYLTYNLLSSNLNIGTPDQNYGADDSTDSDKTDNNVDRAPVNINKVEGSTVGASTMTEVIAQVKDTVVEIVTENIQESQFYGQYVTSGAGSGVIINENGYIITNNHVVAGANTIYVRTTDQTEYKATLIGRDEESDIAVIKIDATGLKAATLGDSSAIMLGEDVVAIGNPLGSLGGTVTNGIISALDREVTIDGQKMRLLQTNAAVNPGNSGGGLFNMAGELIGVVNAKSSSSSSGTTIEGLGFAIPINHAFDVASQLIEYGYVRGRVSLDITYYVIDTDRRYPSGFTSYIVKAGIYVEDPGKNTELKKNDRFVSIDGKSASTISEIKDILAQFKVGDQIKAVVARTENNKEVQVEVTLTCYESVPTKN